MIFVVVIAQEINRDVEIPVKIQPEVLLHIANRVVPERRAHGQKGQDPDRKDDEQSGNVTAIARDEPRHDERRPRQPSREFGRTGQTGEDAHPDQRLVRLAQHIGGPEHQPPCRELGIERGEVCL